MLLSSLPSASVRSGKDLGLVLLGEHLPPDRLLRSLSSLSPHLSDSYSVFGEVGQLSSFWVQVSSSPGYSRNRLSLWLWPSSATARSKRVAATLAARHVQATTATGQHATAVEATAQRARPHARAPRRPVLELGFEEGTSPLERPQAGDPGPLSGSTLSGLGRTVRVASSQAVGSTRRPVLHARRRALHGGGIASAGYLNYIAAARS